MSKKMLKRSLALGALMAFVITGSAMAADVTNENVTVNGGIYSEIIYGGKSDDGAANNNSVTINGGQIKNLVFGGSGVTASNNRIVINDGKFTKNIYGGALYKETSVYGLGEVANSNEVVINGGVFGENVFVYGGSAANVADDELTDEYDGSTANYNKVVINNGTFTYSTVIGGGVPLLATIGTANNNEVVINGGVFTYSTVIGGLGINEAKGNTVYISGSVDLKEVNLFGGANFTGWQIDGQHGGEENPNTLNIGCDGIDKRVSAWSGTIGSAQGFDIINIYEGSSATFKTALNDENVTVKVKGATWNVDKTNTVGSACFDATSTLKIDGAAFVNNDGTNGDYALNGNGTLTVEQGAKLTVNGIAENTYNIAKGFQTITGADKWQVTDLNTLMEGKWVGDERKNLQLQVTAKKAEDLAEDMGVSVNIANTMTEIINIANDKKGDITEGTPQADVVKFAEALADVAPEVAGQAVEAVVKMAEAGGNSATAANIVKNVTGVTNDRLSFNCGHSAPHKGGHGVGLFEEGSGADIWVEYVHGKDKVEDMKSTAGATSYEGQYNGFVMGVDFKKVNKFQSGIAFNYGEGDTNSVGTSSRTHSDYDFWGVGYYGNIHNDDSNVIFDINYAKTNSDVTNYNIAAGIVEASPETTTWTAGVKVEKLYQNENVQIVPYTGLRYMSIDPDDYKTKGASYSYNMERQDIWLLPLGVSIKQEIANDNGWTVSPRVDLSYIWAFGDTNSNMGFGHALDNKVTNIGYDVMDDGSFLGLVGIEAHKGQWGYGVAYSYQKGDHSESKKWYVDVNYSF